MTEADIQLMERELGIFLPEGYRQTVVPFQIPALAGNTDTELWDDAPALVTLNRELRAGSQFRPAWPAYLFAVGDRHGDELIALDTRSPEGPVWWLDHGMVESKESYQSHPRFVDWVEEFYREQRSDLTGDGPNPNGTPQELAAVQKAEAKRSSRGWLIFVGILLFLLACSIVAPRLKREKINTIVLPPEALRALVEDPQLTLYSLDPFTYAHPPVDTNYYHGYRVLGTVTVTNATQRAELVANIKQRLAKLPRAVPACIIMPRHALHAVDREQTYDLLICFECGLIDLIERGKHHTGLRFQPETDPRIYNALLEAADVRLGPMRPER